MAEVRVLNFKKKSLGMGGGAVWHKAWGVGFRVKGFGRRVCGSGFIVQGVGLRSTLEATHGQIDGLFSQLPYKGHQNRVASVGD